MGGSYSIVGTVFGQMTQASSYGHAGFVARSRRFVDTTLHADLAGRTVLVTGANSGIGRAAAQQLAQRRACVHMLCRNAARGAQARDAIVAATGNERVELHVVDVSRLRSVVDFARSFLARKQHIDVLVHNAGALATEQTYTDDGIETTFATHVVGPFLLTQLLAPALHLSTPSSSTSSSPPPPPPPPPPSPIRSRVVWVVSAGMYAAPLNVDVLRSQLLRAADDAKRRTFDGTAVYAHAKRAQMTLVEEMNARGAAKLGDAAPVWCAMHPGWTKTPGLATLFENNPSYRRFEHGFREVDEGADTIVWLAALRDAEFAKLAPGGKLFFDREHAAAHVRFAGTTPSSRDVERLVDLVHELTKAHTVDHDDNDTAPPRVAAAAVVVPSPKDE